MPDALILIAWLLAAIPIAWLIGGRNGKGR